MGNAGAAQEAVTLFQAGQEQKKTMKWTANSCIIMLNTYVQGANTKFLVSLGIQFPGGFLAVWLIGPRISPLFDMARNPWSNTSKSSLIYTSKFSLTSFP